MTKISELETETYRRMKLFEVKFWDNYGIEDGIFTRYIVANTFRDASWWAIEFAKNATFEVESIVHLSDSIHEA